MVLGGAKICSIFQGLNMSVYRLFNKSLNAVMPLSIFRQNYQKLCCGTSVALLHSGENSMCYRRARYNRLGLQQTGESGYFPRCRWASILPVQWHQKQVFKWTIWANKHRQQRRDITEWQFRQLWACRLAKDTRQSVSLWHSRTKKSALPTNVIQTIFATFIYGWRGTLLR